MVHGLIGLFGLPALYHVEMGHNSETGSDLELPLEVENRREACPRGSKSINRDSCPQTAKACVILTATEVFPTPPFWFAKEIIFPIYAS